MRCATKAVFGVVSCVCGVATGQPILEDDILRAGDRVGDAQFGSAIAVEGTIAVIGAPRDTENGSLSGVAYVFDLSTGAELFKLLPDDGGNVAAQFGLSVAIDGGVIAVGAPGDSTNGAEAGSVYLFDAGTGGQMMEITAADGVAGDELGTSVALGDGYLAVGAAYDGDGAFVSSGSVYVFNPMTGAQINKVTAFDRESMDSFGESVAIGDGYLVVGCRRHNSFTGAVYLFDLSSGGDLGKLTAMDGDLFDAFGTDVAIDGGIVAVGAALSDGAVMNSGSVYLFDAASLAQLDELFLVDGAASDTFGSKIEMSDGLLVVGAGQSSAEGVDRSGAGFVLDVETGALLETLVASDAMAFDFLGRGVGFDGGAVVLGAVGDDDLGLSSGSAYVYARSVCAGDLDGDGSADFFDVSFLLQNSVDYNGDTGFDFFDISDFLQVLGAGCP